MIKKKAVLVADLAVSPQYIIDRFKYYNICVVVINITGYQLMKYKHQDLPVNYIFSKKNILEDIAQIESMTNEFEFICGLYGCDNEDSISYADKLFSRLFPSIANSKETSKLRGNKYLLNKHLFNKYGIRSVLVKHESFNKEELINFLKKNSVVVVKPLMNTGASNNVLYKPTIRQVLNVIKENNTDFVVQEYIDGEEFCVDAVSFNGAHKIVSINKYKKNDLSYIYTENSKIKENKFLKINEFVKEVITTAGIKTGMTHIEFKMNSNEIFLIELNPRHSGIYGGVNFMQKSRNGEDQVSSFVDFLIENKYLSNKNHIHRMVNLKNKAIYFDLGSLKEIYSLNTVYKVNVIHKDSSTINNEIGIVVLQIFMCNEDLKNLDEELQYIISLYDELGI